MAKEKQSVEKIKLLEFDNSKLSTQEHPKGAMIIFKTKNSELSFEMTSRGLFVGGYAYRNRRNTTYKKKSFTLDKMLKLLELEPEMVIEGLSPPRNARVKRK